MPGRNKQSEEYRYGFNGAERDDEVHGEGNSYDLGLRQYDPRLARMKSLDPRTPEYPWQSPFVYHRNSPISTIDYLGGGGKDDETKIDPSGGANIGEVEVDLGNNMSFSWEIQLVEEKVTKLSKKVILFGGVDLYAEGDFGETVPQIASWLNKKNVKYNLGLEKGAIEIFNSNPYAYGDHESEVINPIVDKIIEDFDTKNGTLVIYGYSYGGHIAMRVTEALEKKGIKVEFLLTIDAAFGPASGYGGAIGGAVDRSVSKNVNTNVNIYQLIPSGVASKGGANSGGNIVKNVNVTFNKNANGERISHGNIDNYTDLWATQAIIYALTNKLQTLKSMTSAKIEESIILYDKIRTQKSK